MTLAKGTSPPQPRTGHMTAARVRVWCMPRTPLTANAYLRLHWAARRREGAAWSAYLAAHAGPAPSGRPLRARLSVVVRRRRLQDPDNAVASLKPLLDALVRRGWLADDSGVHLELEVREEVSKVSQTWVKWEVLE
jgi:hypothetical protein